jgi:hypothetical protein
MSTRGRAFKRETPVSLPSKGAERIVSRAACQKRLVLYLWSVVFFVMHGRSRTDSTQRTTGNGRRASGTNNDLYAPGPSRQNTPRNFAEASTKQGGNHCSRLFVRCFPPFSIRHGRPPYSKEC